MSSLIIDEIYNIVDIILLNIKKQKVDISLSPKDILDSLEYIELIVSLENVFKIEFDDSVLYLDRFDTIESFVKYIDRHIELNKQV